MRVPWQVDVRAAAEVCVGRSPLIGTWRAPTQPRGASEPWQGERGLGRPEGPPKAAGAGAQGVRVCAGLVRLLCAGILIVQQPPRAGVRVPEAARVVSQVGVRTSARGGARGMAITHH